MTTAVSSPAPQKPRLFVVPHIYAEDISVRELEFACRLADRFEVFVLKWRDALHVDATSLLARRFKQFSVTASSAVHFQKTLTPGNNFTPIELPVWQPILLHHGLRCVSPATSGKPDQISVEATLLDHFTLSHPPPKILNCAIEGAEAAVFDGASCLLREHLPILLVEMHSPENHRLLTQKFSELGDFCRDLDQNHVLALPQ